MSDASKDSDHRPTPPSKSAVVLLLGDITDATWRMFVPGIGGILLGFWADTQFGSSPWLLIAGIILGLTVAGFLVWRLLKKLSTTENKRDSKR